MQSKLLLDQSEGFDAVHDTVEDVHLCLDLTHAVCNGILVVHDWHCLRKWVVTDLVWLLDCLVRIFPEKRENITFKLKDLTLKACWLAPQSLRDNSVCIFPEKSIFPMAHLANMWLYASYFRGNNPKQWSTPTSKNNINKQQD